MDALSTQKPTPTLDADLPAQADTTKQAKLAISTAHHRKIDVSLLPYYEIEKSFEGRFDDKANDALIGKYMELSRQFQKKAQANKSLYSKSLQVFSSMKNFTLSSVRLGAGFDVNNCFLDILATQKVSWEKFFSTFEKILKQKEKEALPILVGCDYDPERSLSSRQIFKVFYAINANWMTESFISIATKISKESPAIHKLSHRLKHLYQKNTLWHFNE